MITNVLLDHKALVPLALLLLALACVAVGHLILRTRRWITWALLGMSMLPVVGLPLAPSVTRLDRIVCTAQFAMPTLGSVELLANVALFIPPVYLATLATGRPLAMLAAGVALSAAIETVQALVPAIGRACDTNDWLMNTIGAAAGALLAAGTLALTSRHARDQDQTSPR